MSALKPYEPGRDPLTGYVTRDGRKVWILATDVDNPVCPIVAAITDRSGTQSVYVFDSKGRCNGTEYQTSTDLMLAPERHEIFANVYYTATSRPFMLTAYRSKAEADEGAGKQRLACVRITFTEGEGLEP